MEKRLIWHDARLWGMTPVIDGADNYYVDGTFTLAQCVSWIENYAVSAGGLDRLDILCHGLSRWQQDDEAQESHPVGGFGLMITREGINLNSVGLLAGLKGLINVIVIYACATSNTNPKNAGTMGDGRALVKKIVRETGAYVIASDYIQYGYNDPYADPGSWEGNLNGFDKHNNVTPLSRESYLLYPYYDEE